MIEVNVRKIRNGYIINTRSYSTHESSEQFIAQSNDVGNAVIKAFEEIEKEYASEMKRREVLVSEVEL